VECPAAGLYCARYRKAWIKRMGFEDLTLKESSSIAAAAYDRDERTLRITFKPGRAEARGGRYDYLKVPPDVVDEFLDAESHGQFVNWRIKAKLRLSRGDLAGPSAITCSAVILRCADSKSKKPPHFREGFCVLCEEQ
jgi:hypothetical protein